MLDGMNSELELSDDEDDDNIDDIAIANDIVESVYGTIDIEEDDYEEDNNEDDVDIITLDQLPIQTPPNDEVCMPNIVTDLNKNRPPILKQFSTFAKSSIKWLSKPMKQKNTVLRNLEQTEFPNTVPPPISYFMKYFPEKAFSEMVLYHYNIIPYSLIFMQNKN